ncbi:VOC family protein [Subtercola sp. RTI3]|uniref:VOC family protein n=1 Tax=Subtercola sp. RTI3 TaxID=3048639 RepID=UPI002B226670|nr:VOC family protein [Subtercola sp. RTI3]MEA9987123.1 glyoxalase [Subtercola sp. RTI3]
MSTTNIFVTVPVADLEVSKAFYTALGYTVNPNFSDESSACIVLSDTIYVMLLAKSRFGDLTDRELVDPKTHTQALHALGVETRDEVDALAATALDAGGSVPGDPQDFGFMYARDIEDPDGNGWQITWMDPAAQQNGPPAE